MKREKGQMSMEYLMVMGFALIVTVPLVIIFFEQSSSAQEKVSADNAAQIARQIIDTSEQVYYLGEPSATTIKANMPDNVEQIIISGNDLTFRMQTGSGLSDVTVSSDVNLTGGLSSEPGIHNIKIEATANGVSIADT